MKRYFISIILLLHMGSAAYGQDNPYRKPLEPINYDLKVTVVKSKSIGSLTLRDKASLGVEVRVEVVNYLPRALEPTLVVDGEKVGYSIGVVGVEGDTTTLGFVVPKHTLLRDGGTLSIQMGDDEETRASLSKPLSRNAIQPLDEESAIKFNLPMRLIE